MVTSLEWSFSERERKEAVKELVESGVVVFDRKRMEYSVVSEKIKTYDPC